MVNCKVIFLCAVAVAASPQLVRTSTIAQEPFATVFEITAAQRLALEQIDQLVTGNQFEEAVELIVRTIDEADGRLVAVPRGREIENEFVRYVPLELFLQDRLLRWGVSRPDVLQQYRKITDVSAEGQLRSAQSADKDVSLAELVQLTRSMFATRYGDDALLLLADRAMQRGWMWTAIAALRRIDARWQAVEAGQSGAEVKALGWELVLPKLTDEAMLGYEQLWQQPNGEQSEQFSAWPLGCYNDSDLPQTEVGLRLLIAYGSVGELETARRLGRLLQARFAQEPIIFGGKQQTVRQVVQQLLSSIDKSSLSPDGISRSSNAAQDWSQLGRDAKRVYQTVAIGDISVFPSWIKQLEMPVTGQYLLPDEPVTGWSKRNLSSDRETELTIRAMPIIHQGLVLLQKGEYLFAVDAKTGETWPEGNLNSWFYQHASADGIKPKSGLMPADGQPWFVVGAAQGRVVGRFGPNESGWLESVRPEFSTSQIVLSDLDREGQVFSGYPIRARSLPDFRLSTVVEFEGTPLLVGSRMYVGLTRRDNATLTTSVGCYDVASGQLLFETELISSARHLPAETANHLAGALVSYREGIVYYHGDSGAIAAMDAESGQLLWLVRYPRAELNNSAFPRRRRASGGKFSPVALLGPLAISSPSDLDRLMAVDAMDGRLVWVTAEGEADDVDQVLGEVAGQIIVGGDSLYRLDRTFGAVVDRWPAGTTSQIHGALPQPRRQGRGLMAGDQVFWPTSESVWVFDAASFTPVKQLDLRPTGLVGGDLAAVEGTLVVSDGQRVAGFHGQPVKQLVSAATSNE